MLTPPGLKGKQYRVTGNAYPRLRRPNLRRRFLLLGVSGVAVLAVLGWGTFQLTDVFGGKKASASGPAACASGTRAPGGDAAAPSAGASARTSAAASASAAPVTVPVAAAFAVLTVVPKPATVIVNVYNATDRSGLAGQTATLLKQRGFAIGKIGNAPPALQHKVLGTAQVTGNLAAAARMTVVGTEVAGAKPVTDLRKDGSVDLVLGNGFTALSTPAQAAQSLALAARPVPTVPHC